MTALSLHSQTDPKKPRPYWHVDAKWILGLLLSVVIAVWLILIVAYRVTAPGPGVELTTNILTLNFNRDTTAQIDTQLTEQIRQEIANSPDGVWRPLPNFPVEITEQDLLLSGEELRIKVFRQIAEPLYNLGASEYAKTLTDDPLQQQEFARNAAFLDIITKQKHDMLGGLVLVVGLIALAVATAAIFVSHRFGRIVTPAVVGLAAALPGLVIFSGLKSWVESSVSSEPSVAGEQFVSLLLNSKGAFEPLAAIGQNTYFIAVVAALVLLACVLLGKVIHLVVMHYKQADTQKL